MLCGMTGWEGFCVCCRYSGDSRLVEAWSDAERLPLISSAAGARRSIRIAHTDPWGAADVQGKSGLYAFVGSADRRQEELWGCIRLRSYSFIMTTDVRHAMEKGNVLPYVKS